MTFLVRKKRLGRRTFLRGAVGGSAEARSRQLARSLRGVSRILGAPAPA